MPEFSSGDWGTTRVWASPSVADRVRVYARGWTFGAVGEPLACDTLVAVGGGTLIDEAKVACRAGMPIRLVAIASLWGSGAESSKVVVLSRDGKKDIRVDPLWLPDVIVTWPELGATVDAERARRACGDVWSHALEGLLSPLATPTLRREIGTIVTRLLEMPLAYDPEWFDLSARACAAQAQASVGLVHGIAHTLEGVPGAPPAGHAALCATFLAPVLEWNRRGAAWRDRLAECDLSEEPILAVSARLHEPRLYAAFLPLLEREWRAVLRDPSTRTNGTLVRPEALSHFLGFKLPHPVA